MSKRLDPSWVVVASIENPQHDRCVDLFARPDGSFGFEEFRRDAEDAGAWTPVSYFSGLRHTSTGEALAEATRRVAWLALRNSRIPHGHAHPHPTPSSTQPVQRTPPPSSRLNGKVDRDRHLADRAVAGSPPGRHDRPCPAGA